MLRDWLTWLEQQQGNVGNLIITVIGVLLAAGLAAIGTLGRCQ